MKYLLKPLSAALLAVALCGAATASDDHGGPVVAKPYKPGVAMTKAVQAGITPDSAIAILKVGNGRFVAGKPLARNVRQLVTQTALGQFPFASILGCIDSRAAPELVLTRASVMSLPPEWLAIRSTRIFSAVWNTHPRLLVRA